MEFDNTLEVPLPRADAWKVLLDMRRVAGCIPGAELTEVVDENTYKGRVSIKLGPIALTLAGQAKLEGIDHLAYAARVRTHGSDSKGRGSSDSVIDFRLEPAGTGTRVLVHTDVKLSGSIAQYGRGAGMIQSFAQSLITQFGECLKRELAQSQSPVAPVPAGPTKPSDAPSTRTVPVKPISGLSLLGKSLWKWMTRWFRR